MIPSVSFLLQSHSSEIPVIPPRRVQCTNTKKIMHASDSEALDSGTGLSPDKMRLIMITQPFRRVEH